MLTENILDLIANTPLVRLRGENIYAKAEFLNPGGRIKDRVAIAMDDLYPCPQPWTGGRWQSGRRALSQFQEVVICRSA